MTQDELRAELDLGRCQHSEWPDGQCKNRAKTRWPTTGGFAESYYRNLCTQHRIEAGRSMREDREMMEDMREGGHFG